MKSKLKCRLRLKIALLTLIVFVCGFLLGLIAQRPKKEFTASAATYNFSSIPYYLSNGQLSNGASDYYIPNSGLYGVEYEIVFNTSSSSVVFMLTETNGNRVAFLDSGDTVYFNSTATRLRVANNSTSIVTYSFSIEYKKTPLAAPVVSLIEEQVLSWDPVPNAELYHIYKNGEYLTGTAVPAVNLYSNATFGNGEYQVKAIADPDSLYSDSPLSNSVTYSGGYAESLDSPILSYSRYILSWNFIVYADTFYIYYSFNGQDYELQAVVNSLSYSPSTNGYYYVVAHSFSGEYVDSPPSNIVNISNLTPTSSDNILHGILSACNDFLNLRLFGDNSITIGFLFSLGVTGLMLGIIIRLFFHG